MNYFRTIKAALDASIGGICQHYNVSRDSALQMAGTHLRNMSQEWRNGQNPTIAYGEPLCRFAYLYCHTAVNANIFEMFLRDHTDTTDFLVDRLNTEEELRVCAFGGGPGTELLALSKLLARLHNQQPLTSQGEIDFTLLDNVPEWSESWNALESAIKTRFSEKYGRRSTWPFTTSKSFQPFDMTRVEQYANLTHLLIHDFYVMNYVVSEIYTETEALGNLVNTMANAAPSGSRFLVIDRNQDGVIERANDLLTSAGLDVCPEITSSTNMDSDEQCSVLSEYVGLIGWNPRIQWNGAFCLIAVKP